MSQTAEVGQYMDDKLYEAAARLQGASIPSFMDYEVLRRLTPDNQSNILHVAARYGNQAFISAVADWVPAAFRYELLCKHNSKGETPLHLAAQFGDFQTVQALLDAHDADGLPFGDKKKPCWRESDNVGDTPLHKALRFGHDDIALLLLQRDLQTLAFLDNKVGESPAYLAAYNFCPKFLRTILDADRNGQCSMSFSGPFGQTAFHPACRLNEEILSLLIERRKQLLHAQDNKGKTILHYAVEENSETIVEALLKANSSLAYLQDHDGLTPLHRAAVMGFFPIIQTILKLSPQSIDIREKDHGKTALHIAKMEPCFLAVCLKKTRMKELINEVDNDGNTLLHLALMKSDLQSANTLLEVSGINWRLKNTLGLSPTDLCKSEEGIPVRLKYLASREEEITVRMKNFFDKKIRNVVDLFHHFDWDSCLDYRGLNGDSILHIAARDGHMNIIRKAEQSKSNSHHLLLLEQNSKGETPLHLAAEYGELQVVKAIVSLCSSINRFRNENPQPLAENVEANLVHHLKPWRMQSENGDTPAHKAIRNRHSNIALSLLRLEPELASFVNKEDESLLYLAAENYCNVVLKEILNSDGNLFSIRGPDGRNPLHAAARNEGFSSVSSLVKRRPDLLNKVDHSGKTPLHHAAEAGRHNIIRILLKNDKAAAFIYDNEGFTPLLRAAAKGFGFCVHSIMGNCPHSIELRDLNSKKTVIHLAKMSTYDWWWNSTLFPIWAKQVNECDRDGNTPLHLAILDTDKHKVLTLLQTKGINWRIRNKLHQMPLDLCKQQLIQCGNEEQRSIYKALECLEQRRSFNERVMVGMNNFYGLLIDGLGLMREEELNKLLNSIVVVAALLATITFAALFTIPGGYNQKNGEAEQMKDVAIQVFVAMDVLALFTSIGVLLRYGYAVVFPSIQGRGFLARMSILLLQLSLVATTLAFLCGLYAIVSHSAVWVFIFSVVAAALFATIPWHIYTNIGKIFRRLAETLTKMTPQV